MPYEATCIGCGHFFYGVIRSDLQEEVLSHCMRSHPRDIRHRIRSISRGRFVAHLRFQNDPRYWDALRNSDGRLLTPP